MKLLICAGGTGGGVYPALAVHQALIEILERSMNVETAHSPSTSLPQQLTTLWVGGEGGMESELVNRSRIPFKTIPAAGVHGVGLGALPGNMLQLAHGFFEARRILMDFDPDVLFFTGGYVAVPLALAGRRRPSVLYVPDIEPGLALRTLARFASCIAVTADASRRYFSERSHIEITGYPVRPDLAKWDKASARDALQLRSELPVLLVFGGSKGAQSINRALMAGLQALLENMQIVHITGINNWEEIQEAARLLPEGLLDRYHPFPYLHEEMGAALASADLALSRAGASSLGELPLFGLPAILVPYPYAWRYQKVNADHLASHGAAVIAPDESLPSEIVPLVRKLISDRELLARMRQAMRSLACPKAAEAIAALVCQAAGYQLGAANG